jgi:hypothetical protein
VLAARLFEIDQQRKRSGPKMAELPANLDRPDTPAVSGMHAPLHHGTTTIIVVRIIACVVRIIIVVVVVAGPKETAGEESSSVMEAVMETAASETIGCKAAAALESCGTDRSRAREAAVKATGMECASSKPSRAESTAAESSTPAAAEAASKSAAAMAAASAAVTAAATTTARQGYVWRQHAERRDCEQGDH